MNPDQIYEVIQRCQKTGYLPDGTRRCLLCGDACPDEPMFVGLWIPGKGLHRRLGCTEERLANGGSRVVVYMVCQICFDSPCMADEVEDTILQRVTVQ
jgi:hypothetical protein